MGRFAKMQSSRKFQFVIAGGKTETVVYDGKKLKIKL